MRETSAGQVRPPNRRLVRFTACPARSHASDTIFSVPGPQNSVGRTTSPLRVLERFHHVTRPRRNVSYGHCRRITAVAELDAASPTDVDNSSKVAWTLWANEITIRLPAREIRVDRSGSGAVPCLATSPIPQAKPVETVGHVRSRDFTSMHARSVSWPTLSLCHGSSSAATSLRTV